ncbi:MAG: hypothetical protein GC206_07975 [Alphaproteobacteria bacterium]|nr:hypothetical protein [Alphaproteobacteria bacterium]
MQQVLDFLRVAEDAKAHLGWSGFDFDWRLEKASTNSPFSLTAIAEPVADIPVASIVAHVDEVERVAVGAFKDLARGLPMPSWLSQDGAASLAQLHRRALNGIRTTRFDFGGAVGRIEVAAEQATNALSVLERATATAPEQFPYRVAHGEIDGRMVSVARWRNYPAIQITNAAYGLIWCVLTERQMEQFGGEQTLSDVWRGRRVSVPGRIYYGQNGKPTRIEAIDIRAKEVPEVQIEDVLDADFTGGLSPVEYLDKLHEGRLG